MLNEDKETKPRFGIANFEKRRHPRFLLNLPIEYYPANSHHNGSGHTANASEGGLMVYLPEQVEVGQLLRVKLYFSSRPGMSTVEMLCEVVWANEFEEDRGYGCGLKFVDFPSEDMSKLRSFLKDLSGLSH